MEYILNGAVVGGGNSLQINGTGITGYDLDDGYAFEIPAGGGSGITELTGDITAGPGSGSQVASITAGSIVNADISAIAAIAITKLANIAAGRLLHGSAGGVVTATVPSGDVSMNNSAVFSVTDLTITGEQNNDLLFRSGGTWQRLPVGADGTVLTVVAGVPTWV